MRLPHVKLDFTDSVQRFMQTGMSEDEAKQCIAILVNVVDRASASKDELRDTNIRIDKIEVRFTYIIELINEKFKGLESRLNAQRNIILITLCVISGGICFLGYLFLKYLPVLENLVEMANNL